MDDDDDNDIERISICLCCIIEGNDSGERIVGKDSILLWVGIVILQYRGSVERSSQENSAGVREGSDGSNASKDQQTDY